MTVLTVNEAAKALRVSTRTIYELIHTEKIEALRVGGTWRIPEDRMLEALTYRHEEPAPSQPRRQRSRFDEQYEEAKRRRGRNGVH